MFITTLMPFALLVAGAASPTHSGETRPKCAPPILTAKAPSPGGPARKLGEMPQGVLIVTVDTKVDGCPVMLVLDSGGTGVAPGWTPAPEGDVHTIE